MKLFFIGFHYSVLWGEKHLLGAFPVFGRVDILHQVVRQDDWIWPCGENTSVFRKCIFPDPYKIELHCAKLRVSPHNFPRMPYEIPVTRYPLQPTPSAFFNMSVGSEGFRSDLDDGGKGAQGIIHGFWIRKGFCDIRLQQDQVRALLVELGVFAFGACAEIILGEHRFFFSFGLFHIGFFLCGLLVARWWFLNGCLVPCGLPPTIGQLETFPWL